MVNSYVEKYHAEKILLFGSAARGKLSKDSDLDFLIIKGDKKDPYDRMVEVYRLVEKDIAADFIIYTPQELAERLSLVKLRGSKHSYAQKCNHGFVRCWSAII